MGPFQITVFALRMRSRNRAAVFGPMSIAIFPAGTSTLSTSSAFAVSLNSAPTRWSTGRSTSTPDVFAFSRNALAVPRKSSSTREVPTEWPCVFVNVKDIPPPMIIVLTRGRRDSSTAIFVETFAPPMTATKGFAGFSNTPAEELDLLLHEEPGDSGKDLRHTLRGGMRAVRRAERVVDVHVAERGELRANPGRSSPPRGGSARSPAARRRPASSPSPPPPPAGRRSPGRALPCGPAAPRAGRQPERGCSPCPASSAGRGGS